MLAGTYAGRASETQASCLVWVQVHLGDNIHSKVTYTRYLQFNQNNINLNCYLNNTLFLCSVSVYIELLRLHETNLIVY